MFTRLLCATVGLLALVLSNTAIAKDCKGPNAILEGGYNMGSYQFIQHMTLVKRSGSGHYGLWQGTEYEQISKFSMPAAMPAAQMQALQKAVKAGTATIPGMKAKCTSSMSGGGRNITITSICKGDYPFEIRKDNRIYVQGGGQLVGTYTPETTTSSASMSIDMLKGAPGYAASEANFNMTGQINKAYELGFGFKMKWIMRSQHSAAAKGYSEYELVIDVKPASSAVAKSLKVKLLDWDLPKGTLKILSQSKSGNKITTRLRLYFGIPDSIPKIAGLITVNASAKPKGQDCEYSRQWTLDYMMIGSGITK